MKFNRTNCNLKTCIKKRRIYFKDRFYSKKSRLLAFLFLVKTTFFILYDKFNEKNKLAFVSLRFCRNFFRFSFRERYVAPSTIEPDYKFVNLNRGASRHSPKATNSATNTNEPDYKFVNHGTVRHSPETTNPTQPTYTPILDLNTKGGG
jgi:hypothetical protein